MRLLDLVMVRVVLGLSHLASAYLLKYTYSIFYGFTFVFITIFVYDDIN